MISNFLDHNIAYALDTSSSLSLETISYQSTSNPSSWGYIFQLLFSLVIVFGLIYLVSRYILPRFQAAQAGKLIEVVDRAFLEPHVTAYIIRIGSSSWLITIGNKQVTLIDRLKEPKSNAS